MRKNTYDCLIGSIHESNNYGPFEVLGLDHVDKYYIKYFKIRFLNTNYETIVQLTRIRNGNVKDYTYLNDFYATGSIHESNNYGPFEILGVDHIDAHRNKNYKIKFLKTGYETVIPSTYINDGSIKDPYAKTVCGIACKGEPKGSWETFKNEYSRWNHMIHRCYNPKDSDCCNYGALGVTVCDKWLCFEYYLEDLPNIPGYNEYIKDPDNYQLDKDILQQNIPTNMKVYSPETCMFVHRNVNAIHTSRVGANNNTGYYGITKYHNTNNYIAQTKYQNIMRTIGVYETPELAAGAYNWFVVSRMLDKPLNPVRTLTEDEVINLDLRDKRAMCYIINN